MYKSTILAAAALAGSLSLANTAIAADEWRQVAYACESGDNLTVSFRETGSAVKVAVADRKPIKLNARPADTGFRYSDSRHELRGDGTAVTFRIDNKSPVKCTSGDPSAQALASLAAR